MAPTGSRANPQRLGVDRIVEVRRLGLMISESLPLKTWQRVGQQLAVIVDSSAWCLGDWLLYGEREFPDRYREAIRRTGLEHQTLRNYAWVARRFPLSRRRDTLSFTHHMEVASLSEPEQDLWLDRANVNRWTRAELRRNLKGQRAAEEVREDSIVSVLLQATAEQERRWKKAAETSNCNLDVWATTALDNAAAIRVERIPSQPTGVAVLRQ